ncbi:MAG: hypothetical protein IPO70_14920 [Bacteroidetes bacterium]|nr:hypothetical protein [Bacteroidota bacterium]
MSGASDYQYKIENNALGFVAEVYRNSTLNDFRLTWLPSSTGGFAVQYHLQCICKSKGWWFVAKLWTCLSITTPGSTSNTNSSSLLPLITCQHLDRWFTV